MSFYQTEEGQVGLPFGIFPGGMYFIPAMFDEQGLAYPPQKYGEKYKMPDGSMVDWNWDTVTKVSQLLTVDKNGKNATETGFDATQIVQIGYTPQYQSGQSIATFYGGASSIYSGAAGAWKAAIPDSWKAAWKWYYDGMWGKQPFTATGPLQGSTEFGSGNVFNSGKAAMGLTQTWYTCCLTDLDKAGVVWQVGIQPMGPMMAKSMAVSMPIPSGSGKAPRIPMLPSKFWPTSSPPAAISGCPPWVPCPPSPPRSMPSSPPNRPSIRM